jgi:hypothetical protein
MCKTFTDVEVFLAACGQRHASTPVPRNELSGLYKKLIDEEYQEFLEKHKDDINVIYLYVNSPKDLKRKVNIEGYYTGTYYKRHDIGEIKEIIRVSKLYNAKVIHELTDGYIVEPVKTLDNNHVIDKRNYHLINDNAMIDSMRDRD